MAITRAQQARQMYKKGQGPAGGASAGGNYGGNRNPDQSYGGSGGGETNRERGIRQSYVEAARIGALKNLAERQEDDKIEEKLETFRNLGNRNNLFNKVLNFFPGIGLINKTFGPFDNRDYMLYNKMTREQRKDFANLPSDEQEETFDKFMEGQRNRFSPDEEGDGQQFIFPQYMMPQAPSIVVPDPEEEKLEGLRLAFRANGGRIGFFAGGQGPAGGASAGGNYGGNRNPDQSYGGSGGGNNGPKGPPKGPTGDTSQKTPVVVNPIKNLQTHFDNNQKLKDAVALGLITNEEYNTLGGYDVKQTLGMGPVDTGLASLGYNVVQSIKGNQPLSDIFGDVARNVKGATSISPELKAKYENIMQMAEGGSMNDQIRQAYGLGSIVKKATRAVKKVAKSDIGKAALLGAVAFGIPGMGATGGLGGGIFGRASFGGAAPGIFGFGGIGNALALGKLKATEFLQGSPLYDEFAKQAVTRGPSILSKFPGGITGAITAVSLLPLLGLGTGDESEEEAQALLDKSGIDIEAIRKDPNKFLARAFKAEGGSMKEPVAKKTMPLLDMGGQEMDLRAEGGFVPIGRMEKADDVPARLSKNEFVFTADAVRNAGEGDVDKGAEVMYNMMKNLEAGGEVSEESQGLEGARNMFQTSKRLEEVL